MNRCVNKFSEPGSPQIPRPGLFLSCVFFLFCACCGDSLSAQQVRDFLIPVQGNPVLAGRDGNMRPEGSKGVAGEEALSLPFFDDFSYGGPYPSQSLWEDRQVFVNNTYPLFPPTYGVATFDGLNENGQIYPHAKLDVSFSADTLCSRPVRLDSVFYPSAAALTAADSVYFSFYYQPGGGVGDVWSATKRGTAPSSSDVLVVEFFNPVDSSWEQMWSSSGLGMEEFCPEWNNSQVPVQSQQYFRQVRIPVRSSYFFRKNFRFRFRSKSTINSDLLSAGGQWHVDYVYLDKGRTYLRDALKDVAFVEVSPSLLSEYSQVPYRQFRPELLRGNVSLKLTNLWSQSLNCRYRTQLCAEDGSVVYTNPETGALETEVYPFSDYGYTTDPDVSKIAFDYGFDQVQDGSVTYQVRHILESDMQDVSGRRNDTLIMEQRFGSVLAYDDGLAEAGWGLNYSGAAFAYRFTLSRPDTLTAVHVFFNPSYEEQNRTSVDLLVWGAGESDTVPGEILCRAEDLETEFVSGINRFAVYRLPQAVVLPAGDFYVGFEQNSAVFLNIGFDQNASLSGRILYSYYDRFSHQWEWVKSMYTGALMMRPAFGADGALGNESQKGTAADEVRAFRIFPNPVSGREFSVRISEDFRSVSDLQVELYDMKGSLAWKKPYRDSYPAGDLHPGLYIVRLVSGNRVLGHSKLVIVR